MSTYRILVLNTLMEAGGAQKAMLQLSKGLVDRGHDVTVATMYDKGGFVQHFEDVYDLEIIDLQMKPDGGTIGRGAAFARGIYDIIALLRERKIQVLQTFSHYSNIIGPVAGKVAGVPVCVTSQRMSLGGQSRLVRKLDGLVANSGLTHRMVSVSEDTREYCIKAGIAADKVVTIPNGIDIAAVHDATDDNLRRKVRRREKIEDDALVVTTVGRLHRQKGHVYQIEAIKQIVQDVPNARFLFVGDGALREDVEGMVDRNGLRDVVRVLGARQDVPELLAASDLFVLPSLWEGMPNAVMEAMATGLPVIATAVDGTPEVVADGTTGVLVAPRDAQALADAMRQLLVNPDARARMGAAGKERVCSGFTLTSYIDRHEALYRTLLAQAQARHLSTAS